MHAPQLIKYRGKLYRRAYTPPSPYPRSPKEVMAGVVQMKAGLPKITAAVTSLHAQVAVIGRLLWQIDNIATDARTRKPHKDWVVRSDGGPETPREHFQIMGEALDRCQDAVADMQTALKQNFAKAEYLTGK